MSERSAVELPSISRLATSKAYQALVLGGNHIKPQFGMFRRCFHLSTTHSSLHFPAVGSLSSRCRAVVVD